MSSISISKQWDGLFSNPIVDDSLDEYRYVIYNADEAVTSTQTNFKLTVRDLDSWVGLHEGYVKLKCHVTDQAGAFPDTTSENCAIENNIANVFTKSELRIGDTKIDSLDYLGLSSMVKLLPEASPDWIQSNGETMLYVPDNSNNIDDDEFDATDSSVRNTTYNPGYARRKEITLSTAVNTKKINTFMIPLRHLFPILNDFRHPIKGVRQSVHLWKNEDVNIFSRTGSAGSANDFKLVIDDISLLVPVLVPTLQKSIDLDSRFASGQVIPIDFNRMETVISTPFSPNTSAQTYRLASLSERPVRVWIAFQNSNRLNNSDQTTMSQVFDFLDLESLHIRCNSYQYPQEAYNPDWASNDYTREYNDFTKFSNFDLTTGNSVPYKDYKNAYPIYCIDMSAMPESVFSQGSTADLVVRFKLRSSPPSTYHLCAFIESEAHIDLTPISTDRVKITS